MTGTDIKKFQKDIKDIKKTEREILNQLMDIELQIADLLYKEEKIEKEESAIQKITGSLSKKVQGKDNVKFKNAVEWKYYIWDNCEARIMKEGQKTFEYWCKLLNNNCSFENCPKNIIE